MRPLAYSLLALLLHSTLAQSVPSWTRDKIVDLRYELIDRARVEDYSFNKDGTVAVTLGRVRGGRLHLSDGDAIKEKFTLISMRSGVIAVRRRSEQVERFRYSFEHKT